MSKRKINLQLFAVDIPRTIDAAEYTTHEYSFEHDDETIEVLKTACLKAIEETLVKIRFKNASQADSLKEIANFLKSIDESLRIIARRSDNHKS